MQPVKATISQREAYDLLKILPLGAKLEMQYHLLDIIKGYQFRFIQICCECGKMIAWCKCIEKNQHDISHGYCPECAKEKMAREGLN